MRTIVIDGSAFDTMSGFYDEAERKFTSGLTWKIGRNLDAFNDVLRGGFGVHAYGEPIVIRWLCAGKSRGDLGCMFDSIVEIINDKEDHNCTLEFVD